MKFSTALCCLAIVEAKAHPKKAALTQDVSAKPASLRRARQQGRKLLDEEPQGFQFLGRPLQGQLPFGQLIAVPRDLLESLFGNKFKVPQMETNVGEFVDQTRNAAGSTFDAWDMLTSGFTQRGRNALEKAANVVTSGVNFGTNGLSSSLAAVQGLHGEAQRVAGQTVQATKQLGGQVLPSSDQGLLGSLFNH